MQIAKAQISLRVREVKPGPSVVSNFICSFDSISRPRRSRQKKTKKKTGFSVETKKPGLSLPLSLIRRLIWVSVARIKHKSIFSLQAVVFKQQWRIYFSRVVFRFIFIYLFNYLFIFLFVCFFFFFFFFFVFFFVCKFWEKWIIWKQRKHLNMFLDCNAIHNTAQLCQMGLLIPKD